MFQSYEGGRSPPELAPRHQVIIQSDLPRGLSYAFIQSHASLSMVLRECRRMPRPLVGDECDGKRFKRREATFSRSSDLWSERFTMALAFRDFDLNLPISPNIGLSSNLNLQHASDKNDCLLKPCVVQSVETA